MAEDREGAGHIDAGVSRHEWQSRWEQLVPELRDDPRETLPEAVELVEEMLRELRYALDEPIEDEPTEDILPRFRDAQAVALRVDKGDDVDPAEIGDAIATVREIYAYLIEDRRDTGTLGEETP
jgi:hypothetical protein